MRNIITLLLSLTVLILPSMSFALDVYGEVHPQRYTFFLTPQGGNALNAVNDKTAALLNTAQQGNMNDALTVNALQKEGYDRVGIAPFYPSDRSQSAIRDDGQQAMAKAALTYRFGEEHQPVTESQILSPRRWQDESNDLWTTYQRIQENLIKGGLLGRTTSGKRAHTRAVNGIDGDVKLNRALWVMAENMLHLAS